MRLPFEVSFTELTADLEPFVSSVFSCLESDFLVMPKGKGFLEYSTLITEDDGTARDKVTRIQHLAALGASEKPGDEPKFEVIACIGGRGFGVRREDMKKLLLATVGFPGGLVLEEKTAGKKMLKSDFKSLKDKRDCHRRNLPNV